MAGLASFEANAPIIKKKKKKKKKCKTYNNGIEALSAVNERFIFIKNWTRLKQWFSIYCYSGARYHMEQGRIWISLNKRATSLGIA